MDIPRYEQGIIEELLAAFPVVLLTGARQVGKTTLVRRIAAEGWPARYFTLDDPTVREACLVDPDRFLAANPGPLALDEVQAAPDLLRAIKLRVDQSRTPGSYLLTGSANLLAMRQVEESLAGRVAVRELEPLSWAELHEASPGPSASGRLFSARSAEEAAASFPRSQAGLQEVHERVLTGGYPTPALSRSERARLTWFESYVRTYVERDIAAIAGIEYLGVLGRLLRLLMLRSGNLLNVADLSRTLQAPVTTLRRYIDLLSLTYQVFLLPPHAGNPERRLVKAPKVYGRDSGLTAYLGGMGSWEDAVRDARDGALLETFVCAELRADLRRTPVPPSLSYWRTHAGQEVDFVLQRGERVVGIEVKATAHLRPHDSDGLRALAQAEPLHLGVILYLGGEVLALDERTVAIPIPAFFGA